ncbi:hypothetical protein ABIE78_005213 [Sinorhizobium fredii]|nr:hypothetical protein [Sinorhizobium fredii]
MKASETQLKDDLLWGACAIAREIGRGERATYYLLERGELPAKKVCGRWVSTKSKLRRYLAGEQPA